MKKLIIQIIISSIFIFNSTFLLFGQEKVIHGKVTTFESIPLIGVSIKVKSTKELVVSDTFGMFTVFCFPKDKLKVTARGFSNENVKIDEDIKYVLVNLRLNPGTENREMAIGYGHVKYRDKLYAVSGLNEKDTDFSHYNNIYDLIKGKFPGVQVSRNNEIVIRGSKSFLGSSTALLIVDGMEVEGSYFGSIPTMNILSIDILKDASASIYGVRGANGVVIVETKGGKNQ